MSPLKKIIGTGSALFMLLLSTSAFCQSEKPQPSPEPAPAASEKKDAPAEAKKEEKKSSKSTSLSSMQVSTEMAKTWCAKLEECDPKAEMKESECRRILKNNFDNGFKNAAKIEGAPSLDVSRDTLDLCAKSVQETDCNGLKSARTLTGCEFIGLLNQI